MMNLGEPGRLWPLMALFDRELRWKGAREVVLARVLPRALACVLLLESPRPPPIAWYRDRRRPPPYASALQGCCIKSSSLPPSNLPIFPRDAMDGSKKVWSGDGERWRNLPPTREVRAGVRQCGARGAHWCQRGGW